MKVKKIDMSPEKQIITGLITSGDFARQIMPIFHPDHLKTSYARIVGEWVKEFYEQFKDAPGKAIQDIYRAKRGSIQGEEENDLVADFLIKLSADFENATPANIDYSVRQAELYLKTRSIEALIEDLQDSVQKNDPLTGEQKISNYNRIERATGEGISLKNDPQDIIDAFNEEEEFLFRFPSAVGEVIGDLNRGDFLSFMAPMKRGKTWFLWYSGEVAMRRGFKVVFFTGEMTKKQVIRRGWRSTVGKPKVTKTIKIPYFEESSKQGKFEIKIREELREGIKISEIIDQQKKLRRIVRGGDIKTIQIPGYQTTVPNIEAHLDNLEHYDNYLADVVIIDYADLLLADKRAGNEYRHQIDNIWKGLRRIAQERNILVITASQTAKETFDRDIRKGDASEDIRKIAHVTSAVGINQKKDEVDKGVIRISQLAVREDRAVSDQAVVLQCLDIGKPCIDSKFQKEMVQSEEPEKKERRK